MKILKESIENMYSKGLEIGEISRILDIKMAKLRQFMLDFDVYPNEKDKEFEYFKQAKIIKNNLNSVFFITDLPKITGISISRVKMLCNMYDLKPCRKVYCEVCGKEIDMGNSTVVKKYCSKKCYTKNNRPKKEPKPLLKTCVSCGTVFEGKSNSKFCSDKCRQHDKEVKESIKWLKQL